MSSQPQTSRDFGTALEISQPDNDKADLQKSQPVSTVVLTAVWILNFILLVVALSWGYLAGNSPKNLDTLGPHLRYLWQEASFTEAFHDAYWAATSLSLGALLASLTALAIFAGLFVGPPRFRTIRCWLLFTALACGWLTLVNLWSEVYWLGQQRRMLAHLPALENFVSELNSHWPKDDGDFENWTVFLAYPKGNPRTLMGATSSQLEGTSLRTTCIEKVAENNYAFELSGSEEGAWLEYRSQDDRPNAFLSGLQTPYRVVRSSRLSPHWFLVRYEAQSGEF